MRTYIAFLRGINVSGKKKIIMADLRQLLTDAGLNEVQTYLQSGNVLFRTDATTDEATVLITSSIVNHYGFEVKTIVLTTDAVQRIVDNNPFGEQDTKLIYVTLLATTPTNERAFFLEAIDYQPEAFIMKGKQIYVFAANGYGRAKLNNNFFERKLKVAATTRNWKTVNVLLQLANH